MSGLSVASLGLGGTRQLGALANDRRVYHPLIAIIALFLAGCASDPSAPDITTSVKTVTVNVPVPVPCIAVSDIPNVPPRTPITAAAGPEQKAAAVDADLKAYVRYAELADPLIQQCSKGVTSP